MKRLFAPILFTLTIAACAGSPEPTGPSAATLAETPGEAGPTTDLPPTLAPTPTSTLDPAVQEGEFFIIPDGPPPPSDYLDLFERRLASGEWSTEQGLVTLLQFFAGEVDPGTVLAGTEPAAFEMGGVIALAQEYLANGEDAAARSEVERLMIKLIPDAEAILRYAAPAQALRQDNSGTALFASALLAFFQPAVSELLKPALQDQPCEDLWAQGFPPEEEMLCFEYTEASLPNGTGRVFYPFGYQVYDPGLVHVLAAAEAMVNAVNTFAQYGTTGSINMVFAWLNSTDPRLPLAIVAPIPGEDCLVIVYPSALASAARTGIDVFKQVMAHEMFHCFERWNFPAMGPGGYKANQWWIEGAAEYFGNVVYPNVNREWGFVGAFNAASINTAIPDLVYENTTFFQHLANSIGNQGVVGFLKGIPLTADHQTSIQALAAIPGIDTIFEEFGQAWADQVIEDSGGLYLPTKVFVSASDRMEIDTSLTVYLSTQPFVLRRYLLIYMPDKIYQAAYSPYGAPGSEAARPDGIPFTWGALPATISGGCGKSAFLFLTTSTKAGTDPHLVDVVVTDEEDPYCDLCVAASWELDNQNYIDVVFPALFPSPEFGIEVELNSLTGSLHLNFTRAGIYSGVFSNLVMDYSVIDPEVDLSTQTIFSYAGQSYGTYRIEGNGTKLSIYDVVATTTQAISVAGGVGEPKPIAGVGWGTGQGVPYTCVANSLTFQRTDPISGVLLEFRYNRRVPSQ